MGLVDLFSSFVQNNLKTPGPVSCKQNLFQGNDDISSGLIHFVDCRDHNKLVREHKQNKQQNKICVCRGGFSLTHSACKERKKKKKE